MPFSGETRPAISASLSTAGATPSKLGEKDHEGVAESSNRRWRGAARPDQGGLRRLLRHRDRDQFDARHLRPLRAVELDLMTTRRQAPGEVGEKSLGAPGLDGPDRGHQRGDYRYPRL